MKFQLFHISFGFRRACAMAYDEARQYTMLFFDLDQRIKTDDHHVLPREMQPGMNFELSPEEMERAKTASVI